MQDLRPYKNKNKVALSLHYKEDIIWKLQFKNIKSFKSRWLGSNERSCTFMSRRVASWGDLALAIQYNAAAVNAQISEAIGGWGA